MQQQDPIENRLIEAIDNYKGGNLSIVLFSTEEIQRFYDEHHDNKDITARGAYMQNVAETRRCLILEVLCKIISKETLEQNIRFFSYEPDKQFDIE